MGLNGRVVSPAIAVTKETTLSLPA